MNNLLVPDGWILRCLTPICCGVSLYLSLGLGLGLAQAASLEDKPVLDQRTQLCPPGFIEPVTPATTPPDTRVQVSSDQAQIESDHVTTFSGDVHVVQDVKQLQADLIRYDRGSDLFDATGHIVYKDANWRFEGDDANFNLSANTGKIHQARYAGRTKALRGEAQLIELEAENKLRMDDATYTTCPRGSEAWLLSAHTITLDNNNHQGSAESVSVQFMGVPFLFLPYLRFPIGEQRLSGFLFPTLSTSDRHGTEISIPYYWNLDPQYDLTVSPHLMSKRGWMLESEFRYLGKNNNGGIAINDLPNDQVYGATRQRIDWFNQGRPEAGWSTYVSYSQVSDPQYIGDFSTSLATSSITHLDRRGELAYNSKNYVFDVLAQSYQAITGATAYKRLPQISLDTRFTNKDNQLNYDMNAELVRFDHLDQSILVGDRLHLNPYISYPWRSASAFFIPKLSVYSTYYSLSNIKDPVLSKTPGVTVPVYSIDTGLIFDRNTRWGDSAFVQTLEPRLYYLYAPYKDQSHLPLFDTGLLTFNELTMFAENRFSGRDLVGDADQLAAAVSTHLYNSATGRENMALTFGELFNFHTNQVLLPGQSTTIQAHSSLYSSLSISPAEAWRLRGNIQWNPTDNHIEIGNASMQYRLDPNSLVNLDYRYQRNELRTYGGSFAWRLSPGWQLLGSHRYDVENNHKLENILGVQYDSCCWAVKLVGVERFNTIGSTISSPLYDKAIYLTLELKGLSNFGQYLDVSTILKDGINGYTP